MSLSRLSLFCTHPVAFFAGSSADPHVCRRDGVVNGAKSLGKLPGVDLAPTSTPQLGLLGEHSGGHTFVGASEQLFPASENQR